MNCSRGNCVSIEQGSATWDPQRCLEGSVHLQSVACPAGASGIRQYCTKTTSQACNDLNTGYCPNDTRGPYLPRGYLPPGYLGARVPVALPNLNLNVVGV